MPVARISSMTRAGEHLAGIVAGRVARVGAERVRAVQMPRRDRRRGVPPHRRVVQHDRHAVRHERLALRIAVRRASRASCPDTGYDRPCGRWQPEALNAMPASIAAYIISLRASKSFASRTARTWNSPTRRQRLRSEQVGERIRALRHRTRDAARRIEPARPRARGRRLERVAHAVEAGGRDDVRRQRSRHFGIDQRDRRDQPARDDAGLRVERRRA